MKRRVRSSCRIIIYKHTRAHYGSGIPCGGTKSAVVHGTLALPGGCPQARAAHRSVYIELVYTHEDLYTYALRAHAKTQCSERATNRDECSDVFHADESNNSQTAKLTRKTSLY